MNVINQLSRESKPLIYISKRYARKLKWKSWKNDWLPFTWTRPTPEQGYFDTGDRVEKYEMFDKNLMPKAHSDAIKEVGDVPIEIQNLLTYEFQKRQENINEYREHMVEEKANSELGLESLKGLVVDYTYKIRKGRQLLRDQPNHVGMKTMTSMWRGKRLKYMLRMNQFDKEGFEKLLAELEVDQPRMVIGARLANRIERKKELRRLTKEYCDKIYEKKMKKLHEELIEEQKKFVIEKKEFDEWMSKMMKEFKIEESQVKID